MAFYDRAPPEGGVLSGPVGPDKMHASAGAPSVETPPDGGVLTDRGQKGPGCFSAPPEANPRAS